MRKSWSIVWSLLVCSARLAPAAEMNAIIDLEGDFLVGAYSRGKWLSSEAAAKLVKAGTEFHVFNETREILQVKGGKPENAGDPLPEVWSIPLKGKPANGIMAMSAGWNPYPRAARPGDNTQATYIQAVKEFLQGRGLKSPKVRITQLYRVDLDGDGEDEVLISATNYTRDYSDIPHAAKAGNYSFVLLRHVEKGKVETQLVMGEIYLKDAPTTAPSQYSVKAFMDLNGDGVLEAVLSSAYYEGGWTSIHQFKSGKLQQVLETGGGA